jgi:thiopurine S-methyltransferase
MDPAFWRERWQKQETGFHQPAVNDLLQQHWAGLGVAPGSAVFVPLCGRSLDMVWLARQGHRVIGIEVSELAVDAFFAECGLKSAGGYELWCGDFFALPAAPMANVAGVYDRASLIAFPASMQERYTQKLKELTPPGSPVLLITLDYDQERMAGPPFATPRAQVQKLFADRYAIEETACRSALERNPRFKERGLTALDECAYTLRPR